MRLERWKAIIANILMGVTLLMALPAGAQIRPWEEYSRHIASKGQITGLSDDLFHDQVDLYNGRLSFRHVDIDIAGNSALPVTLARTFNVQDPIPVTSFSTSESPANDFLFADWELDIPRVSGVFAHKHEFGASQTTDYAWSNQRCSGLRVPPRIGEFHPNQYWSVLRADMPSGGEMLQPVVGGGQNPSVGGPYRWVTSGFTWFSCLPTIQNGTGEGFLAITSDGTKYWFDWMAGYKEPTLVAYVTFQEEFYGEEHLFRKRNVLYATRVEDRFGNWVTYEFSNAASAPARLERILSSDGRQITAAYNTEGHISSASDGTRTWTYQYEYAPEGNYLEKVILPDASKWEFDMEGAVQFFWMGATYESSCNFPGRALDADWLASNNAKLTITHPSGAVGEFDVGLRLHGRSNVPDQCEAEVTAGPDGSYSAYVRMYWINSLIRKRIIGPGLPAMQWDYQYKNSQKTNETHSYYSRSQDPSQSYAAPGSWAARPYTFSYVVDEGRPTNDLSTYHITEPVCVSDACAGKVSTEVLGPGGEWARHTFGNSYRYNEHKLLKVERGTDPNSISRTEQLTYELARSGQPFPSPVGLSRQWQGDGLSDIYLRPLRSNAIIQDGLIFNSTVNSFDMFGRPLSVTKSSSPAP